MKKAFSNIFLLAVNKDGWVLEAWGEGGDLNSWSLSFLRRLNDLGDGRSGVFVSKTTTINCEKRNGGHSELERK